MSGPARRVALMGGAFNPPHEGHRRLAERALASLALDELRFMPTATSPHKPTPDGGQGLDGQTRLDLLKALLHSLPGTCSLETLELERGGTSYTADSLEALGEREPDAAWILVMGMDQGKDLLRWRRAPRILELASVAIAPRPGWQEELPAELADRLTTRWTGRPGEVVLLPGTDVACASSEVREQVRQGATPVGLLPEVLAAIQAKNLYRE